MRNGLSASRAAFVLAAIAVVSALLSNFVTYIPGTDDFPKLGDAPLLPGIYFGLVLCLGTYLWERSNSMQLALVLAGVVIAWILAWRTALSVYDFLHQLRPDEGRAFPQTYALAGLIAASWEASAR
jgi:hypothetical protein